MSKHWQAKAAYVYMFLEVSFKNGGITPYKLQDNLV